MNHFTPDDVACNIPPGTPAWITQELIEKTVAIWQPYYRTQLTTYDAIEMLIHISQLFRVLRREGGKTNKFDDNYPSA